MKIIVLALLSEFTLQAAAASSDLDAIKSRIASGKISGAAGEDMASEATVLMATEFYAQGWQLVAEAYVYDLIKTEGYYLGSGYYCDPSITRYSEFKNASLEQVQTHCAVATITSMNRGRTASIYVEAMSAQNRVEDSMGVSLYGNSTRILSSMTPEQKVLDCVNAGMITIRMEKGFYKPENKVPETTRAWMTSACQALN